MPTIIHIETATEFCSCALSVADEIVVSKISDYKMAHSKTLGVFVEEIMQVVRENNMQVDAISVSSGPGSYTGLRIGVSQAKGLSYGLNIPLISIPTPLIMAYSVKDMVDAETLLCPMIDARRMEVYATLYDTSLEILKDTEAQILDESSYSEILSERKVCFFGNGAQKFTDIIDNENALYIDNINPQATSMVQLALEKFNKKEFVDTAYFEPFYLKEFNATTPKKNILF